MNLLDTIIFTKKIFKEVMPIEKCELFKLQEINEPELKEHKQTNNMYINKQTSKNICS